MAIIQSDLTGSYNQGSQMVIFIHLVWFWMAIATDNTFVIKIFYYRSKGENNFFMRLLIVKWHFCPLERKIFSWDNTVSNWLTDYLKVMILSNNFLEILVVHSKSLKSFSWWRMTKTSCASLVNINYVILLWKKDWNHFHDISFSTRGIVFHELSV